MASELHTFIKNFLPSPNPRTEVRNFTTKPCRSRVGGKTEDRRRTEGRKRWRRKRVTEEMTGDADRIGV